MTDPALRACATTTATPGSSNVVEVDDHTQDAIEITSLDETDFRERVDVFKIDVEGFETKVLQGGREFFQRYRPRAISEVFPKVLREFGDSTAHDYVSLWESYGYRVSLIEHDGSHGEIVGADLKREQDFPPLFNISCQPR